MNSRISALNRRFSLPDASYSADSIFFHKQTPDSVSWIIIGDANVAGGIGEKLV